METRNSKLLHSSTTDDDRISSLPEELLCHILSFLPTKQSVATSVLSKKWESLWRSVTTLDFDDDEYFTVRKKKEVYAPFVESVYKVMFSRKIHQSIKKFRLRCTHRHFYDPINVSIWANSAVKRRVQHLDICLGKHLLRKSLTNLSSIFTCTTLVVLKLRGTKLEPISSGSVHLPFLKLLHLHDLYFSKRACLAALLSGCPILEDFKATFLLFHEDVSVKKPLPALQQPSQANTEFKTLPKLLRAHLSETIDNFLLEVVSNVKFLHIDKIDGSLADDTDTDPCVFPMFHNLTRIKLFYSTCNDDWSEVVELLKNCPKLQVLVINQPHFIMNELDLSDETANWQYPPSVPKCILSHLKTCYLNDYRGTKGEVRFARYIMRNGRVLESMTVCCGISINQPRKLEMLTKLSSCTRRSKTCELSFK